MEKEPDFGRMFYREDEPFVFPDIPAPKPVPPNILDLAIQETEARKKNEKNRKSQEDFMAILKAQYLAMAGIPEYVFKSQYLNEPPKTKTKRLCPICRNPACNYMSYLP